MVSVLDFPIWEDCPLRSEIPERYEIRRVAHTDEPERVDLISVYDPKTQLHIDVLEENWSAAILPLVLRNLAVAIHYKEATGTPWRR